MTSTKTMRIRTYAIFAVTYLDHDGAEDQVEVRALSHADATEAVLHSWAKEVLAVVQVGRVFYAAE